MAGETENIAGNRPGSGALRARLSAPDEFNACDMKHHQRWTHDR